MPSRVIVDGNNVIGSVPDGWWRDRPGAARRLLGRLQCLARHGAETVVLVLDVADPDLPEGDHDGVTVLYARRRGRDAADDRIRELVSDLTSPGDADAVAGVDPGTVVVTSDRALAEDVQAAAGVTGARAFLRQLDELGC